MPFISLEHAVVLVLASFGRDAQTLTQTIERTGVAAQICESGAALCAAFNDSTAAVLLTEEALIDSGDALQGCLQAQPVWSDVPVIILGGGRGRAGTPERWQFLRQFGNVTVLGRPMSSEALMIALEAACRARAWQYVVRDQMQKLEAYNVDLEHQVRERTQALQDESNERKRIESALNEARRLEAIGRLAGGVAHDFNNLLQVISSACNILQYVNADPARTESLTNTILHATERGSKLTQQMLAFGRRQILSTDALDIARHVMDMQELLQQALREKITLELRLQAGLWHANADVTQLEVALLNLAINAKDVLPAGGIVTLTARNVHLPTAQISEVDDLAGDFIWLSVTDNGPGMPPEIAAQAFEPFFTTKHTGEGSGLGLSQVYGFAKQSGGTAWIRTGSYGTSVSLLLPRGSSSAVVIDDQKSGTDERASSLHGLRVLCVEDDDAVRELTVSQLETMGCKAVPVRSADEALKADLDSHDVVFSDVQMPGRMDGIALASEIATRRPRMPVILASGYVVAPHRLNALRVKFLVKPYTMHALRTALLECMGDGISG
ncbi:response regulator [Noviherbaspirillum galbum]|uniref:histidine kinase n=1 Tax=Noviherbaspirillum galbum TaxID=2709383 RepID=A0A6B3SQW6_9BURK|nr:response regulator [Noviherbaspirillum galbum]NEX62908.1 response regulator [Noviherbaspirillum galbum]